jgi:hypothetical protein
VNVNTTAENASPTQQQIDEAYDDVMIGLSHNELETGLRALRGLPQPVRAALLHSLRTAIESLLDTHAKLFEEDTYQRALRYYLPECLDEALKQVVVERYLGVAIIWPTEQEAVSAGTRRASL